MKISAFTIAVVNSLSCRIILFISMCGYLVLVTLWIYPWIFLNNSKFNSKLPHYADSDIIPTGIKTSLNVKKKSSDSVYYAI
jgi:hypothetical protein